MIVRPWFFGLALRCPYELDSTDNGRTLVDRFARRCDHRNSLSGPDEGMKEERLEDRKKDYE